MAIVGIGVDVVRSGRLRRTFDKHGERFLRRYLHPQEIEQFRSIKDSLAQTQFLANRWAVKEATYKAFKAWRIPFPDILLDKQRSVQPLRPHKGHLLPLHLATIRTPVLVFDGSAHHLAAALQVTATHVSLSHDGDYTIAHVVLESSA
ncbi:hypothetical protein AaE_015366 [Aphanomyces astaci]|uniref:4'-phosphopantetheinyl transferase domain-containing protein n=1 Tax=Aphanomyces astaci TaxID=112090 RepID=A0A6A4YZU5_APHAT|nr:hypothetical protein AaE_015366 [Aphanomyces astaci]